MRPWVIRFGRVGDMVLQSVLLHHLRHRYGMPCGLITSGTWSKDIYRDNADVGFLKQLRTRHAPAWTSPEHWALASHLSTCHGPFYVSDDSPKQVSRARWLLKRAGVTRDRSVFLADHPSRSPHWADRLNEFGALTPSAFRSTPAIDPKHEWRAPRLSLTADDQLDVERWLGQRDIAGRPIVLLQPGNRRTMRRFHSRQVDTKAWPSGHWAAVAQHVLRSLPECHVLLCGSPDEARLLASIRGHVRSARVSVAAHDLPLRRLMALTQIAHSMISVDSGPAHIAAALGAPLVVLYGMESAAMWSRRSAVGAPIFELGGLDHGAVSDIAVESVIEAWSRIAAAGWRLEANVES